MYKAFIPIFLFLFTSCSYKPVKWVANGTIIEATKYRLEISDSSKILVENEEGFTLLVPHDSLLLNKFTISYSNLDSNTKLYFRTKANQQVKNTLNPKVTEYYKFDKGNVLFLGYSTSDTLKPYTVFEPALVISPREINKKMKSSGVMKTFILEKNAFDEGVKATLKTKELKEVKLKDNSNNNIKVCNFREMVLSRDATVSYGKNNLIVPEAIMFKTKLLVDQNGYPIAEWSIKTDKNKNIEQKKNEPKRELCIEFTKYKQTTN